VTQYQFKFSSYSLETCLSEWAEPTQDGVRILYFEISCSHAPSRKVLLVWEKGK